MDLRVNAVNYGAQTGNLSDGKPKSRYDINGDGTVDRSELEQELRSELNTRGYAVVAENLGFCTADDFVECILRTNDNFVYDNSSQEKCDEFDERLSAKIEKCLNSVDRYLKKVFANFQKAPSNGPEQQENWGLDEAQWEYVEYQLAVRGVKYDTTVNDRLNHLFNGFNQDNQKVFNGIMRPAKALDNNWDYNVSASEVRDFCKFKMKNEAEYMACLNRDADGNPVETHVLDFIVNQYMTRYASEFAQDVSEK